MHLEPFGAPCSSFLAQAYTGNFVPCISFVACAPPSPTLTLRIQAQGQVELLLMPFKSCFSGGQDSVASKLLSCFCHPIFSHLPSTLPALRTKAQAAADALHRRPLQW